jgi:hypothetical protein
MKWCGECPAADDCPNDRTRHALAAASHEEIVASRRFNLFTF